MTDVVYASGGDAPTVARSLDADQAARVAALLSGPVVSLHEHPVRLPSPLTAQTWSAHMSRGEDVLAAEELVASSLDIVIATCFSQPDPGFIESWAASVTAQIHADAGLRTLSAAADLAIDRQVAVGLALEDLGTISRADDLVALRRGGIMMAGVAYNDGSLLGCGLAQPDDTGLTPFGREAISIMNRIGMVVDVSHAGDRTSLEAAEVSESPIVINHAGARAIWPSSRMVPDDVIAVVVERGGVIGIECAPGSTRARPAVADHDIDDVVDHIEYCAETFGIGSVAIGGDTFYGDHVGLYRALGSNGAAAPPGAAPFGMTAVRGADNPTEVPVEVARSLVTRGWSDPDIAAVLGGNALRVLRAALRPTGEGEAR